MTTLGMTEQALASTDEDFRQFLSELSNEDLSDIVEQLAIDKQITTGEANVYRENFLRFIALTKLTGKSLSPDRKGDAFWHTFIVNTRQYAEFCEKYFGAFIHHEITKRPENNRVPAKGPLPETAELMWDNFAVVANCNNTCMADWKTKTLPENKK